EISTLPGANGAFCEGQTSSGAFGLPAARRITTDGTRPSLLSQVSTVAGPFCIARTGSPLVDANIGLPAPAVVGAKASIDLIEWLRLFGRWRGLPRGRWAFGVLRQRVGDLIPGGLRADPDVLHRSDPGVVVEGAGRDDAVVAVLIDAGGGRAAGSTERLAEETRSRKPVDDEGVRTVRERHAVGMRDEVAGERGGARLTTAATVTEPEPPRCAADDEPHLSAEATPAQTVPRSGGARLVGQRRHLDAGGICGKLRQAVRDLEPRRLRADEDVGQRAHDRVDVERARGYADEAIGRDAVWHRRAAVPAKGPREIARRCIRDDGLAAAQDVEVGLRHHHEGRERRAVGLATARAVAVGHELRIPVDAPRHRAAETAPRLAGHAPAYAGAPGAARGRGATA